MWITLVFKTYYAGFLDSEYVYKISPDGISYYLNEYPGYMCFREEEISNKKIYIISHCCDIYYSKDEPIFKENMHQYIVENAVKELSIDLPGDDGIGFKELKELIEKQKRYSS